MERNIENVVYWTLLSHNHWNMYTAATKAGLCYIGSPNASFEELETWVKKRASRSCFGRRCGIIAAICG